jgi:hypothetical protein
MNARFMGIYLNDHLAGATTGLELARRSLANNEGTEFGGFLAELAAGIEADRDTLEAVMETLGVQKNQVKRVAGWAAERVARLKLNGQLRGYSPLSRLLELEFLLIGITGKLGMWKVLEATALDRLASFDLAELIARAESQRTGVEAFRLEAAQFAIAREPAADQAA